MSPKVSKHRSARYPHLFKYPKRSRFLVYRRYHVERGQEFSFSTGEEKNEAVANDIGEKEYHKWLALSPASAGEAGSQYFREYAQAHLNRKLARPDSDFSKNSKATSGNATRHLIEAFGDLKLEQISEERWEDYCNRLARAGKPPKLFNRRKELKEILLRAHRNGLITRLPTFRNPDAKTEAGRFLEDWEVKAIMAQANPDNALFYEILWRQGARPREVLQYRWDMINWRQGDHGTISIPEAITKTRRARTIPLHSKIAVQLKNREKGSESEFIFPSPEAKKGAEFPIVEYRASWDRAVERAAEAMAKKRKKMAHAVIYDLRRTFVTNCARKGKPILWVARYIDSSTKMIESFYAKTQHDALQGVIE